MNASIEKYAQKIGFPASTSVTPRKQKKKQAIKRADFKTLEQKKNLILLQVGSDSLQRSIKNDEEISAFSNSDFSDQYLEDKFESRLQDAEEPVPKILVRPKLLATQKISKGQANLKKMLSDRKQDV